MKERFVSAIFEVIESIKNAAQAVGSVRNFFNAPENILSVFKIKEPYIDMRGGEPEIKNAFGLLFWMRFIFSIPALVLGILISVFVSAHVGIVWDLLGIVFWFVVDNAVTLAIMAAFVAVVSYYSGAWVNITAKIIGGIALVFGVMLVIGFVIDVIGIIGAVLSMALHFNLGLINIIGGVVNLVSDIVQIALCIMLLDGLGKGMGYYS